MISKKDTKIIVALCTIVCSFFVSLFFSEQKQEKPKNIKEAYVVRVVDGDTIVLNYQGTTTKARLIGIDTPESVDPRKPVECYGKEAKEYVTKVLTNALVYVETDITQGEYDKYGRMLVYIYVSTSTPSVNQDLIEKGYAREYTYAKKYIYADAFKKSETQAQQKQLGVWNSEVCR